MRIPGLRHSSEKVGDIVFFGRMLDKIRLHAAGKLPPDYNRGTGLDAKICRFLRVEYPAVVERVLAGGADTEILEWCFAHGRTPGEEDTLIFNSYLSKRGWRDEASGALEEAKRNRGFAARADIQTFFDFHKADEESD